MDYPFDSSNPVISTGGAQRLGTGQRIAVSIPEKPPAPAVQSDPCLVCVPPPPASGTYKLKSIDGVLTWV